MKEGFCSFCGTNQADIMARRVRSWLDGKPVFMVIALCRQHREEQAANPCSEWNKGYRLAHEPGDDPAAPLLD